jgi:hypothetical protein
LSASIFNRGKRYPLNIAGQLQQTVEPPGDMPDQGMRVMQISADCDSQGTGHGLAGKSSLDYDGLLDRMGK